MCFVYQVDMYLQCLGNQKKKSFDVWTNTNIQCWFLKKAYHKVDHKTTNKETQIRNTNKLTYSWSFSHVFRC